MYIIRIYRHSPIYGIYFTHIPIIISDKMISVLNAKVNIFTTAISNACNQISIFDFVWFGTFVALILLIIFILDSSLDSFHFSYLVVLYTIQRELSEWVNFIYYSCSHSQCHTSYPFDDPFHLWAPRCSEHVRHSLLSKYSIQTECEYEKLITFIIATAYYSTICCINVLVTIDFLPSATLIHISI